MSERVVSVELQAKITGFLNGFRQAKAAAGELNKEVQRIATEHPQELRSVGVAFTGVGLAAAAAAGLAVKTWADFDQQMSAVQAATHESTGSMKLLEQAALEAGARTSFSAAEAANAVEELAKAGVETTDILSGGLDGALDLAAAGGLGVAEAAGIAATALKTFNLQGTDMSHVADLLAAGAGKAMGDVTDMSAALNQSALVANKTGLSIEETTAGLAAFASQGLLGSDAGTSFKTMLQSLTPSSKEAEREMKRLGISAYDSQGNFIGLANYAGVLRDGLKHLSVEEQNAAMKTIFGADAVRAATVLYDEGADGIEKWIEKVNDQGYAADTARARLNNLKGDLEELSGSLETAMIKTGSAADGPLRAGIQQLTKLVNLYTALPPEAQSAAMGIAVVTAGVSLLSGAMIFGTIQAAAFKNSLATLGVTRARVGSGLMSTARFLMGPWGIAMIAAGATVAAFNKSMDASTVKAEQFETALKQGASAFGTMQDNARKNANVLIDVTDATNNLGDTLNALAIDASDAAKWITFTAGFDDFAVRDSLKELGVTLSEVAQKDFPAAAAEFQRFGKEANLSAAQLGTAIELMPAFKSALIDTAKASGLATDDATLLNIALGYVGPASKNATSATEEHTRALAELEGKTESTGDAVSALADQIRGFGSAQLSVREANRSLEESYDALRESVKQNGSTLNIHSKEGRENEAALDNIAKSALNAAAATYEQSGSQEKANKILSRGRDRLIGMLEQFGITGAKAQAYADKLGLIPENLKTAVDLETDEATKALNSWIEYNSGRTVRVAVGVGGQGGQVKGSANGNMFLGGAPMAFADGGFPGIFAGRVGSLYKFAEPETRWEAVISGKPGMEARNVGIWAEAGRRLGQNPGGQATTVYVQNPFTGEYLLAAVDAIASQAVDTYAGQQSSASRRAGQ